ncbi:mitochondrial glycine transporter [[Candida] railenensis]|uniref:Mitochondrial glycine transporter n=1 Tax=[Candida] railenensis TaxID=45579 RepID=A0A9P0QP97_9ASCO|nr:mitochondrial glycine transporter [[Candida] railenensis]
MSSNLSTDKVLTELKNEVITASTEGSVATKSKPASHLLAGGLAGLISAISLQPFDLLKTRLQQQQKANSQYRTSISRELKKLTKIKDLWRGAVPSAIRTSVGAGLYFTSLSLSREYLAALKETSSKSTTSVLPRLSAYENLLSGFAMRALVGFVTMPITVIKTRFESNAYSYNSMYEGVEGIYLDDVKNGKGSMKNFFRGSIATLARDCPYAGLYVLFYESFKNDFVPKLAYTLVSDSDDRESFMSRSALINSSSAVLAASVSTTITAPFDAIKTRLQLSTHRISIWEATKSIISEKGGFRNLFRGLSLRFGRKGLSAGISWCIYEEMIKGDKLLKFKN